MSRIKDSMSPEGVGIHVRTTFLSLKCLPSPFALGHNSLNPSLTIFEDYVEIRSIRRHRIEYCDVEQVSAFKTLATRNVRFKLKGKLFSHTADIMHDESFLEVLEFLDGKGVSLTDGAGKFIEKK